MYNKKLIPIICVLIALLLSTGCDITKNEKLDYISFNIKNETNDAIATAYISFPGSSAWNSIISDPLPNGEIRFVTVSTIHTDSQYKTDLQVITASGVIYTKPSYVLNTNNNGVVTFTTSDVDHTSSRTATLRNNTGQPIAFGFAGFPHSAMLDTLFASELPNGSSRVVTIPASAMNSQYQTELTLATAFGVWYTKPNCVIAHGATINFTSDDFNPDKQWPVSIRNNTGITVTEGFARLPEGTDWVRLFEADMFIGETQSTAIPTIAINSENATDIRLVATNGVWYTKPAFTVLQNALISFSSIDLDNSGPRLITVANNTEAEIGSVSARLPGGSSWEVIFTGTIANGSTRQVTIPISAMDSQWRSDLRLESTFGVWYTRPNLEINYNANIDFSPNDLDLSGPAAVSIENYTGEVFTSGYACIPGGTEWVSIFTTTLSNDSSLFVGIPTVAMNSSRHTDIQLRTASEVLYTKYSISMQQNAVVTFTSADFDLSGPRDAYIKNLTGETLASGFATLPGTTNWVDLFQTTLTSGDSLAVAVPASAINAQSYSSLKMATEDGVLYTKLTSTLHKQTISFTISDIDINTPRTVYITNNTGQTITLGNIRFPGSPSWHPLFTSTISNGGSITASIITTFLDIDEKADLQLKNASGLAFTRLSQPIAHNGSINFTVGDLELTVNLQNNTSGEIASGYAKLSTDSEWTMLFVGNLAVSTSRTVMIPSFVIDEQGQSYLQLRTSAGVLYTKVAQNITPLANIPFTNSNIDPLSPRSVIVQNNTGKTLAVAYAKLPASNGWGSDILQYYILAGTSHELTIPTEALDDQHRTDLMLKTWEQVPYIKLATTINHYATLTFTTNDTRVGKVGSGGGYIFHDKAEVTDGWQYLEAAPVASEALAEWGLHGIDCTGTSTEIGSGAANTATIVSFLVANGEIDKAAQLCDALSIGVFTDWFLPSKDELNQMYINLAAAGIGGFNTSGDFPASYYWSSSAGGVTTLQSWMQRFSDGGVGCNNDEANIRESAMKVRAVRRY